ncbi:putative hydrolase [Xylogone sp. PMI_703]|nr:putative hydrolase [Xylogone sp. PMI_703]
MAPNQAKVAIQHVTVFDGQQIKEDQTVAFESGLIVSDATGAETVIDAKGSFLIPGLIDAHAHVHDAEDLALMAHYGVTTCLDMGTANIALLQSLSGGVGTCDVRSSGIPAMPPASRITSRPGFPQKWLVSVPEDAPRFIADRISERADYIKVMIEPEGPDQPIVKALVTEARVQGRKIIAHATTCDAIEKAIDANVDVITHVPLEQSLSDEAISKMKAAGSVAVPTLIKMLATSTKDPAAFDFSYSKSAVQSMKDAGVLILAGSDANKNSTGAGKVSYGDSMWKELELLVEAGLSPVEALQSATSLSASFFGLGDRGMVAVGKKADLILLSGNPLEKFSNNLIQRVWCGGVQVEASA